MAGYMNCHGDIVIPKTNTFRFYVQCYGKEVSEKDGAELVVRKAGEKEIKLRKIVKGNTGKFRFEIDPKDTEKLDVGNYVYDVQIVTNAKFDGGDGLEATEGTEYCVSVFSPELRKFRIAEAADDVQTQGT